LEIRGLLTLPARMTMTLLHAQEPNIDALHN
jgi:hypothetical protein